MTDTSLENCPFCDCGSPSVFDAGAGHPAVGKWTVICWLCGGNCGWHKTPQEAETAWNKRDELERELRNISPLQVFRVLKANRKRSYRDIAHLIAEKFGAAS